MGIGLRVFAVLVLSIFIVTLIASVPVEAKKWYEYIPFLEKLLGKDKEKPAPPPPEPSTCIDSDLQNYYTKGKLTYRNNPFGILEEKDECLDQNILIERVCKSQTNNSENYKEYTCPHGCKEGACVIPDITKISDIPNQEWDEDTTHRIDLRQFFSVPENVSLVFSTTSGFNIWFNIKSGVLDLTSKQNFFGEETIGVSVYPQMEGVYGKRVGNNFKLIVKPVNDPPKLTVDISDIIFNQSTQSKWIPVYNYFSDVDSNLTFSAKSSDPGIGLKEENRGFVIYRDSDFHGRAEIVFTASDGEFEASKKISVIIPPRPSPAPIVQTPTSLASSPQPTSSSQTTLSKPSPQPTQTLISTPLTSPAITPSPNPTPKPTQSSTPTTSPQPSPTPVIQATRQCSSDDFDFKWSDCVNGWQAGVYTKKSSSVCTSGESEPSRQSCVYSQPTNTPVEQVRRCLDVCTPLYELSNDCRLNNCGSGCGADEINTFNTERECLSKNNWPSKDSCVPSPTQRCTTEYDPVCGVDGKTYGNMCEAQKLCVKIDRAGECKQQPTIPACTSDSWTGSLSACIKGVQTKTYSKKQGVVCEGGYTPDTETIPCNTPPVLKQNIPNQVWDEDTQKTIDLNSYFSDSESSLTFSASSVQNIQIGISGGVVTLTPDKNFYGRRTVVFTGKDSGGLSINSNTIDLTVNNLPEIENSIVSADSKISTDSSAIKSTIRKSEISTSNVFNSTIENSNVLNSKISDSFVDPSDITRSTITSSNIIDSVISDSTIAKSEIKKMEVRNAVIKDDFLESGTIVYSGKLYTGPKTLAYIKDPSRECIRDDWTATDWTPTCTSRCQQTRTYVKNTGVVCKGEGGKPQSETRTYVPPCKQDDWEPVVVSRCHNSGWQTKEYRKKVGVDCENGFLKPANEFLACEQWVGSNLINVNGLVLTIKNLDRVVFSPTDKNGNSLGPAKPLQNLNLDFSLGSPFDGWARTKKATIRDNNLEIDFTGMPDGVYAFAVVAESALNRDEWLGIDGKSGGYIFVSDDDRSSNFYKKVSLDQAKGFWIVVEKKGSSLLQFTGDKIPKTQFSRTLLDESTVWIEGDKVMVKNFDKMTVSDITARTNSECVNKNGAYKEIRGVKFTQRSGKPRIVGTYNDWSTDQAITGKVEGDKIIFDIDDFGLPDGNYVFGIKYSEDGVSACTGQWFDGTTEVSRIIKKISAGDYRIIVNIKNEMPYYPDTDTPVIRNDNVLDKLVKDPPANSPIPTPSPQPPSEHEPAPISFKPLARYIVWENSQLNGVAARRWTMRIPEDGEVFLLGSRNEPDWAKSIAVIQGNKISAFSPWVYYNSKTSPEITNIGSKILGQSRQEKWENGQLITYYWTINVNGKHYHIALDKVYDFNWNPLGNIGFYTEFTTIANIIAKDQGFAPVFSTTIEQVAWVWKQVVEKTGFSGLDLYNSKARLHTYLPEYDQFRRNGISLEYDLTVEKLGEFYRNYQNPTNPQFYMAEEETIGPGEKTGPCGLNVFYPCNPPSGLASSQGVSEDKQYVSLVSFDDKPSPVYLAGLFGGEETFNTIKGKSEQEVKSENLIKAIIANKPFHSINENTITAAEVGYYSPGFNPLMKYSKKIDDQYNIGVKSVTYQIGSGVLNNFKMWADDDHQWNKVDSDGKKLFPEIWSNYLFISDETLNEKTKWTETELVNIKTSEMAKIFHPSRFLTNPNQKPFFIRGNVLKLYEYFKNDIGFPVKVTNIAPDATIIESGNGMIVYKSNPYANLLTVRVYIPSKNIDVKVYEDSSFWGKLGSLSEAWIEGPMFDTFMSFALAWDAIAFIGEIALTQKNNIRIDKVIEVLNSRNRAIQEVQASKAALEKAHPGKQTIFDIKDPVSMAEKVFRTGNSDNWLRARVILTTEELDSLDQAAIRSKGFRIVDNTYKDYVKNPKPDSGYMAKHVDINIGTTFNMELQYMTDIQNQIVNWDRYVAKVYKGEFANNFEVLAYEKGLYGYYDKVQHGFVGQLNKPLCPQILVSSESCFKPNIFLIPN